MEWPRGGKGSGCATLAAPVHVHVLCKALAVLNKEVRRPYTLTAASNDGEHGSTADSKPPAACCLLPAACCNALRVPPAALARNDLAEFGRDGQHQQLLRHGAGQRSPRRVW